jgi:hypothetical protein
LGIYTDALRGANGNASAAAKAIGLTRGGFRSKLEQEQRGKATEAPTIIKRDLLGELAQAERKLREIEKDNLTAHAVRQYIFNLAQSNPTQPAWVNERTKFKYTHGVPTLFLSDLHHGEVVDPAQVFNCNEFDSKISERRIRHVVDTSIMLAHDVLREPKFPGCVLVLGGDNINGTIHEELVIGSDKRIMAQTIEIADILNGCVNKLIAAYGKVSIVGVAGNHGRTTRKPMAKFYAETNFDWLVYQMLERFNQRAIAEGKLHFLTPAARDVTFKIAGRRFRVSHGDQFRGGDSIIGCLGPITRGDNKKRAMAQTLPTDAEVYETLMLGHFHTLYQNAGLIINGSTKGYDEYGLSCNFKYEPPQQAFFLVHENYGINHFMPVLADAAKFAPKSKHWVEVLNG